MAYHHQHMQTVDLKTPVRNRYFYGKLLDVFHFELEQSYFNAKRWLLNRRVFGYGVICGLDVRLSEDRRGVIVLPGIALDKWGREIIVPQPSDSVPCRPLPAKRHTRVSKDPTKKLILCTFCSVFTSVRATRCQP
jgi:hypothetical protein